MTVNVNMSSEVTKMSLVSAITTMNSSMIVIQMNLVKLKLVITAWAQKDVTLPTGRPFAEKPNERIQIAEKIKQ
jgi:hypothetical protein